MQNLSYENEFCMQFHVHANQSHRRILGEGSRGRGWKTRSPLSEFSGSAPGSHFHTKSFALRLALKQGYKGLGLLSVVKPKPNQLERFSIERRKVIGFAFAMLHNWFKKNLRHFFIQSEVIPKPTARVFPRFCFEF